MTWRKWFVRGLVFSVVGGTALGVVAYQRWTNPEAMRQQVLEKLSAQFIGATVSLDTAQLRLFGGISISDLRLTPRKDRDGADFLYVPSGIIYYDKEHLLNGQLNILRLVLQQPRLHLIRGADGTWNVANVLSPPNLNERIPTIVIKKGTIILEDRKTAPGIPPLEIHDVDLTLTNDPLPTGIINVKGTSDLLGPVQIDIRWERATDDAALVLKAPAIPVGLALLQRLTPYAPQVFDGRKWQLEGKGSLQVRLACQAGSTTSSPTVHFMLSEGRFNHPQLPLPLEHLAASLQLQNGQLSLDSCTASSGPTRLEMTFKELNTSALSSSDKWETLFRKLDVKVEHLVLTPEFCENLPQCYRDLQRDFAPAGVANLSVAVQRNPDGKWVKHCVVQATDASGSASEFPYVLEHITGTLTQDTWSTGEETLKLNLTGVSGRRPIFIQGEILGPLPNHRVDLKIWGDDIPLDEKLLIGLERGPGPEYRKLAESFMPRESVQAHAPMGLANFQSFIRRDPRTHQFSNHHTVFFHDTTVRYSKFPYLVQNVSGALEIEPHHWEFHDAHGTHQGGEFRVSGHNEPGKDGDTVIIQMAGSNILLDSELRSAMIQPDLLATWDLLSPGGRIDFSGKLTFPPAPPSTGDSTGERPEPFPEIDLTLYPHDCTIKPRFFDSRFQELNGTIHYANRWVTLDKLRARHGSSLLTLGTGYVYVPPQGGFYARLDDLEGNPLLLDEELIQALPGPVADSCRLLELKDPIAFRTQLIVNVPRTDGKPVIYWDGAVAVRDARIRAGIVLEHVTGQMACRGKHNGDRIEGVLGNISLSEATVLNQPLKDIHSQLLVMPDAPEVLRLNELWMHYLGGEIYGPVRVEFGHVVRYEMKLTASGIKLEDFGRYNFGNSARMMGLASASLYLSGQGPDTNNLRGGGTIDVPHAKIEELPPLLPLLKVLGLRAPDRTAFDEAHAAFDVQGQRLVVNRLDLFGDLISLRGQGGLNLDGTGLDSDFHVDWARLNQVLPDGINKIPPAISDQLLKIKMRGKLGDIQATKEVLPEVMAPLKEKLQEMKPSK